MGRYDRLSRSRSPVSPSRSSSDDNYRLHIADIGLDVSERDIEKAFGRYGEIEEVWMARNPPCFAFVVFKSRGDAEDALDAMNGKVINGSRLTVSWAKPRTRGRRNGPPPRGRDSHDFRCYHCGGRGHFARDCETDPRNRNRMQSRSPSPRGRYTRRSNSGEVKRRYSSNENYHRRGRSRSVSPQYYQRRRDTRSPS